MKQNHYARKRRQLEVLAKKLHHLLIYNGEDASSQIQKLLIKIRMLVQELAHVLSQTDLKRILGAAVIFIGISFTNQVTAQSFAAPQKNPFGLVSTSLIAAPAFADLDGDGDLDLLAGEFYGGMQYFQNTGSASNPQFAAPQKNPFGLISTYGFAMPAFADLDGDGDMDLLVGEYNGAMQYFQNTGSASNPQFAASQLNPFGLVSTYDLAGPAFADLDGDGDMDLLVGEYYGGMQYFQNTGSASNPQFAAPQLNPFGLVSTYVNAFPSFADLDGDGDMDILVGEYYGGMQYFQNTGSASNPQFAAPQLNPFGLNSTYENSFPSFADLDGDGDMDLLVGEYYGAMQYFENTSTFGVEQFSKEFDVLLYPNPAENEIFVSSNDGIVISEVNIYNQLGQRVLQKTQLNNFIDVSMLRQGVYVVEVVFGEMVIRKKLLVR